MGSQDRDEGKLCTQVFQNVQFDTAGTNRTRQILKGNLRKRLHSAITITNGITFLLCGQERRKTSTMPGLPVLERAHDQERLSPTPNYGIIGQTQRSPTIYETGRTMGVQQCSHSRRRSMESGLQDEPRIIRTNSYVLWIVQFTSHIPSHDGRYLQ